MEKQLDEARQNGAEGEDKLRLEIKRLLGEIELIKVKNQKDFKDLETRMKKQKESELHTQKEKYERMIADLKKQAAKDKAFVEDELKKIIA